MNLHAVCLHGFVTIEVYLLYNMLGACCFLNVNIYRNNELEGKIDFSMLPNTLTNLRLHNNEFHGNITDFGHLRNLYYWYMFGNNLNGTVDWSQFARLTRVADIRFQDNDLTGDIDLSYVPFENLQSTLYYFYGLNNLFDGTISLGNMTSSVRNIFFNTNPDITGGVDFSSIISTSTAYPYIQLDTTVYCKTDIYCGHLSCAIPQPRTAHECSGKTACESTCGECVPCSTTSPTIVPSPVPTTAPITVFPNTMPTMNPSDTYRFTTSVPQTSITSLTTTLATPRLNTSTGGSAAIGSNTNYNTFSTDSSHGIDDISTTDKGPVDGETGSSGTSGSSNGLSDSHITLVIMSSLIAMLLLLVVCAVGCAFCLMAYMKHKERMKAQEMSQHVQTGVSKQASIEMRTLQQQHQTGIDSSDMMLTNINSQLKMPVQPQIMRDTSGVLVDPAEIGNVDGGHLQIGEMDVSNVNHSFKKIQNNSDKSRTILTKNNSENENDNDDNVEIKYTQESANEIAKNIVDEAVKDHENRESNSESSEGLYHD